MDGLTVLVEAKKEYLAQLCCVMCPQMIVVFELLYNEANNISKGKKVLAQYQKLLKEVPNWNNHMIHQHVDKMTSSCGWFSDLLAAVFVSYVKILSSVRLGSENKKISLKLPSNDVFVHGCFTNAAKELYKDPFVYHEEMSEYDRDANLTRRFVTCIESTVKDMIPIQEILKTYISRKDEIEMNSNPEPDSEDPEVEEPFPAEEEPPPPPVPEGTTPVTTTAVPVPPPSEEEVKNVQLTATAAPPVNSNDDDGVLFPDAN
jgi:hypothetical protein